MKEECLICKAPLEYLNEDIEMECELCHRKEKSKTRCINGHEFRFIPLEGNICLILMNAILQGQK